jgi:hypothetical protein
MKKWLIIFFCPFAGLGIIVLFMAHQNAVSESKELVRAVTHQLNSHSAGIATLLTAMKTNDTSSVEDAAFVELQRGDSTSLITSSDIHVTRTSEGSLECEIDTSRWGVPTRTIR